MSRAVGVAELETLNTTVRLVGEFTVTVPTVTPEPETSTVAPFAKWVPARTTSTLEAPWPSLFGVAEVTVGSAPATVKQAAHVPEP
jgi:hypothetical protein